MKLPTSNLLQTILQVSNVQPNATKTSKLPQAEAPEVKTGREKNGALLLEMRAKDVEKAEAKEAGERVRKFLGDGPSLLAQYNIKGLENFSAVPYLAPNLGQKSDSNPALLADNPNELVLGPSNNAVSPTQLPSTPTYGVVPMPDSLKLKPAGGGNVNTDGTIAYANGLVINPNSKVLNATTKLLDSGRAHTGPVGSCVTVVTENSDAAGWDPMNGGGSSGDPNNTRGWLVQGIKNGGVSPQTANTVSKTLNSPYGTVTVNMYVNDANGTAIEKLNRDVAAGLIPDGAMKADGDTTNLKDPLNSTDPAPWGSLPSSSGRDANHLRIKNNKIVGHYNWENTPGAGVAYGARTGQIVIMIPPDAMVKKQDQQIAARP